MNSEETKIWENSNIKFDEENCLLLNKTTLSSIVTTGQESDISDHLKKQQQQIVNVGSTFNTENQSTTHWSNFDWTKLTNHEIKLLLEKLHSLGKLYGCIDCQTFYLDKNMANYHSSNMHGNFNDQSSSSSSVGNCNKKFECFLCGVDLNNPLLFLEHFTHCLSLKKYNGIDLLMTPTTTEPSIIQSDNKTINDNNNNNSNNNNDEKCNELTEYEDEGVSEQLLNETIQTTKDTTSQESHTVKLITDNTSDNDNIDHDPISINVKDQTEIQVNGYCMEDIKQEHEQCDDMHTSSPCSVVFSDSVD
ncbi:unnamed protein product [Schistosoma turkestanicum]|nr:unnamed protein product [Schistosoma turkestanicum]